ncbi:MAG: hypothetical protein MUC96_14325 [Myxococcaceae bacterium]|nr:hypothetical protein [Myxococcaceae bacterium]
MSSRFVFVAALMLVGCGSSSVSVSDAGQGSAGGTAGGASVAGGAAGGSSGGVAGGSSGGGSTGGGVAGGSSGGGAGGGGFAGGEASADGGVTALPGGDTCDVAPDVTAGGRFSGTTNGFVDDYSIAGAGCPSGGLASGRDVAYRITAPTARTYTVRVTPVPATLPDGGSNRFDPMLLVQRTCGASACVAGTVLNGPGDPESLTFSIASNETLFVIVDGENVTRGEFELEVSF